MDVRNFGAGLTSQMDADDTLADATSRVYTFASGVGSPTADSADSLGLVTQFTFAAVPEPSTLLLLGTTVIASVAYIRHRRKKNKLA
jgi:hypothetical protein